MTTLLPQKYRSHNNEYCKEESRLFGMIISQWDPWSCHYELLQPSRSQNSMYMYIPQRFLRIFRLWGTLGVWDSGRKREGGVRQMVEERAEGKGSNNLWWAAREIMQKSLIFWNRKRVKGRRPWKKAKEPKCNVRDQGGGGRAGASLPTSPCPLPPLGTSLTLLCCRLTKTSNIQHTNVSGRTLKWEALIDLGDNMIEQFGVKRFAQCISCSTGLFWL